MRSWPTPKVAIELREQAARAAEVRLRPSVRSHALAAPGKYMLEGSSPQVRDQLARARRFLPYPD
jgi:hypothetical protein